MDMQKLAEIFEAVKVLPLRPTDVLVFRTNAALDAEHAGMVHTYLEERTGHANILILSEGAEVEVIRPELEPAGPAVPAIEHVQLHRPVAGANVEVPRASGSKQGKAPGAVA